VGGAGIRLIQHKREAFWFYRFLSVVYERVNPLFWTEEMRAQALELARLDDPELRTVDVGAGTGFATEGIVERVVPGRVTMLDQSPHQLAVAERKPALADCGRVSGDAESLPFETDSFDRYVSAGSIEYWPDPQLAIAEAYRVLRPGGVALIVGPLPPPNPITRRLADLWMLFPPEGDYWRWFEAAGFADVRTRYVAPDWYRGKRGPYAIAIAGTKPQSGRSPFAAGVPAERLAGPLTLAARLRFAGRFVAGSIAGALFIPVAIALAIRARLAGER
jgi:MPBQ/MSBQ methyltransferase